jgi:hypothetical protein
MISLPPQNNINTGIDPADATRKILNIQPVNGQVSTCYSVESPDNGADRQFRIQQQFLFPK